MNHSIAESMQLSKIVQIATSLCCKIYYQIYPPVRQYIVSYAIVKKKI